MSAPFISTTDRPPEGGLTPRRAWASIMRSMGLALAVLGLTCVAAWAQPGSPPRTDPGAPPDIPGGTTEGWSFVTVPNLPAGAELGDVWVSPTGDVYVWANYPTPTSVGSRGSVLDEPVEGERLPNPGTISNPRSSTLYHFNGSRWTVSLSTRGETGVTLFGTDSANIFASTTAAAGEARLYRFDGISWSREVVPGYYIGRLHTMVGVAGDLYFRIDRVILHNDGTQWMPVHELPGEVPPTRGMVYLDANHVFVLRPDGHDLFTNGVWTTNLASAPLGMIEDAWGKVEGGQVHLFAAGSNLAGEGVRLLRFNEMDPVTHDGTWQTMLADPAGSGVPAIGSAVHIWGSCCDDVFATGVVGGEGHLFFGNVLSWAQLAPPFALGEVHGVWGTATGPVWFSTTEGRMVKYLRPSPSPVVSPAVPVVGTRPTLAVKQAGGALQIHYELAQAATVHVGVYDVTGRLQATVEQGLQGSGGHDATWNTSSLVPGVYFVKVRAGGPAFTRRVVVFR